MPHISLFLFGLLLLCLLLLHEELGVCVLLCMPAGTVPMLKL